MGQTHVRAPTKWQTDRTLIRLAALLNVAPVHAYGLVTALTAHLLEERRSGDIRHVPSEEIEAAVGWDGVKGLFASTVLDNYTDGRGVLLHWSEMAEPILKEREANLNRVQRFRQRMRQAQDEKIDAMFQSRGTSANGAASVSSAPSTAPPPRSPRGSTSRSRQDSAEQPVEKRVDKSTPPPRPAKPKPPQPPPSSRSPVTGDRVESHVPIDGTVASYLARHAPDSPLADLVTGDIVMGDRVTRDTRNALRASRAVVQDLEPETDLEEPQRSVSASGIDNSVPATFSVERARVTAKLSILVAMMLGIPVEGVAERDDLVAMYGEPVAGMWKTAATFLHKYYESESEDRICEILNEMILVMTPDGTESPSGQRLMNVPGRALAAAVAETIAKPPRSSRAAWPYTMRKLESGRAYLEVIADGKTSTELASERYRRQDAVIAPAVRRAMDGMTGALARRPVTGTADQQRTALRWMLGNDDLKLELAEQCERTFKGWRQDLPGLDQAKDNWVKREALNRWRAAGRPLPPMSR